MRGYHKLKNLSFTKSDKIRHDIEMIEHVLYTRDRIFDGYILSFKDFKYLAEWKEDKDGYNWLIYWKGKHVCTQPKGDINIVEIRRFYNKNFKQFELNFNEL